MSSPGSWKDGNGEFLLAVIGSTRHAPYLKGWPEFKDSLRKIMKAQPGWVEVTPSSSQRRGHTEAWCRIKDRKDADDVYETYCRSDKTLVHVWETGRGNEGYRLMRCNCSSHFTGVPKGGHSVMRCGIDLGRFEQPSGKAQPVPAPPYVAQPALQHPMYYQPPPYTTLPPYPVYVSQPAIYSTNTTGMPVNVQGGAVLTEAREIFIRNLNYKVTPDELARLLSTVGHPVHSNLHRDSKTGAFKGVATANFATKEEAQDVAARLDGIRHMDMTLQVRMGKDATVVGRAEPMVVNGSYGYR